MGILKKLKAEWDRKSTTEKIDMVIDILCGFGATAISGRVVKQYATGMNRVEKFCSMLFVSGLTMAAGEAATNFYRPYTKAAGSIIDTVKQKGAQNKTKEDSEDGKYTRY